MNLIIYKIKSKIKEYLNKYCRLKGIERYSQNNPYGINMGYNTFMEKPNQINGGKHIQVGDESSLGHSAWLGAFDKYINQEFNPQIIIGNHVRIGNYACITAIDEVNIENGCLISEYVYISDHFHGFDPSLNSIPAYQPLHTKGKVKIGSSSFIGYRVTILSGVTLGRNCVVGAHSVVTKSFPDYSMITGIPAKLIKRYSFEEKKWITSN